MTTVSQGKGHKVVVIYYNHTCKNWYLDKSKEITKRNLPKDLHVTDSVWFTYKNFEKQNNGLTKVLIVRETVV